MTRYSDEEWAQMVPSPQPGFPRETRLLLVNYLRTKRQMTHDEALQMVDEMDKYVERNRNTDHIVYHP